MPADPASAGTAHSSPSSDAATPKRHPARSGSAAIIVLLGLVVVGVLLRLAFLFWHPPVGTDLYDYDTMSPMRDAWFAWHLFAGAPSVLLLFPALCTLAVLVCLRHRVAQLLAILGGLVAGAGAVLFSFGLAAEAATWAWALNTAVVDADAGAGFLRGIEEVPMMTDIILLGNLLIPVGMLATLVALILSRGLPLWVPASTTAVLVVGALLPPLPVLVAPTAIVQSVMLIILGGYSARAVLANTATPAVDAAAA
ncbi:hypothetical protein [Marisediminicola senii]|uniref:hypothetical protein n=1 Tax=Marisediminicola senii TaxID=2711233 RepID=UPI0013EE1A67|nr:hypothetical protein [Marisediminicola senii]